MEAWVGSVHTRYGMVRKDPQRSKLRGGLQGADLAESPCNAHQLNLQHTSIALCLYRALYFVHKRWHAIVPAP